MNKSLERKNWIITDKLFYKSFFLLIIPMVLQNVIGVASNFLDTLMVSRYDEVALAGVGLANQIYFLLVMVVSVGIGGGVVVLVSRYWGQKDVERIKKTLSIALKSSILIAVILGIIVFIFPENVLSIFTDDPFIIEQGVIYLQIITFTYVLFAITTTITQTLSAVKNPKIGFIVSTVVTLIDLVLNFVMIYGFGPIPKMGVAGAAWSTLIAKVIECAVLVFYLFKVDKQIGFRLKDLLSFEKDIFKNFMKVTAPIILSSASWGIAVGFQSSILGHFGQGAITANTISSSVFQVITIALGASAAASSIVIGVTIGEHGRDMVKIKEQTVTFQLIFIILGIVTGLAMYLSKDFLISFFGVSTESYALTLSFVKVLSITCIGTAYQMPALGGIVKGGGDTKFVLINDIIFMWLIVLPAAYIAAYVLKLSPVIIFAILKSDQILKCFVAVIKVNSYNWIKSFDAPNIAEDTSIA